MLNYFSDYEPFQPQKYIDFLTGVSKSSLQELIVDGWVLAPV